MVILARYSPRSRDIKTQHTPLAKEAMPATGLAIRENRPPRQVSTPITIIKPVRNREMRLSGAPLRAEPLMRLIARRMLTCVGDGQRQHGRNNQRNNDQQGDNERG